MSAEIIEWQGVTCLDLPADRVLRRALESELDGVIVLGVTKDGDDYFASSWADGAEVVWHLMRGVYKLNKIADDNS